MPLKERILTAGIPGVGKTYNWATIARMLPENKFYVIDPDDGVRRVLYEVVAEGKDKGKRIFPDLSNIVYYFTPTWFANTSANVPTVTKIDDPEMECYYAGVADAFKTIKPKLKSDDWLIIEMLGNLWSIVQGSFVDEVFQKDIGQYFLEIRKKTKDGATRLEGLKGWTDWQVINKLHNDDFMVPACFEAPCHLYMTTSVAAGAPPSEDAGVKAFYGDSTIRLDGQKHNPFRAQTIILLKSGGKGENKKYLMSTYLKDRGRPWMENVEIYDFALQYLGGVAGWNF